MTPVFARQIATVFGLGYLRPASGTWASLVAVLVGMVLHRVGQFPLLAVATALVSWAGFRAVATATAGDADKDKSEIVIDEIAGQWLALCFASLGFFIMQHGIGVANHIRWLPWPAPVAAFVLFRLFDIWKPGIIGRVDRRGDAQAVMQDDLWAGLFAGLVLIMLAGLSHGVMR